MKKKQFLLLIMIAAAMLTIVVFLWGVYRYGQKEQEEKTVKWENVPLITKESREKGNDGGEGGQWPHSLAVSKSDSSFLLYGTNTGGVYRSENGGENWSLSSQGMIARGCNAFAIDPMNDRYVLCAGINDTPSGGMGIYLSVDRGNTWELVWELLLEGNKVYLDGLEYDESSYNEEKDRCMTAYYSSACKAWPEDENRSQQGGLYRTDDGGTSWELVNENFCYAELKVDPSNGEVYAACEDGLYVSRDRGSNFSCIYKGGIQGFDVSWKDGIIYICSENRLLQADTETFDFHYILSSSYPKGTSVSSVSVSPVNSDYLLIQCVNENSEVKETYLVYYSKDKGKNWDIWNYDKSDDFFPYISFPKRFVWSYEDEEKVWSFGGEHVVVSENGGTDWRWSSNGICGILCGGKIHFNVFDSDILFIGAQDLNGALTTDGGKTWQYMDVSGNGGWGHVYGGYAASEDIFWGCLSEAWDAPGTVTISFDGGKSYVDTGKVISSYISNSEVSSYQAYNDPEVFFAGNYRSADGGRSWSEMRDCLQVYTHNPAGEHELYGCEGGKKGYVLVSYDDGVTWSRVNNKEIPLTKRNCLSEVSIDSVNNVLYVAANGSELYRINISTGETENLTKFLPEDLTGSTRVSSVAVDTEQDIVYVAGYSAVYSRNYTLLYTTDGGETWKDEILSDIYNGQIVKSAMCLDINDDGDLWVATACHGLTKLTGN